MKKIEKKKKIKKVVAKNYYRTSREIYQKIKKIN